MCACSRICMSGLALYVSVWARVFQRASMLMNELVYVDGNIVLACVSDCLYGAFMACCSQCAFRCYSFRMIRRFWIYVFFH